MLIAVVAVLVVVVLASVAAVVVGHRGEEASVGPTATAVPAPSTTTDPGGPPTTPDPAGPVAGGTGDPVADATLAEISRFVEHERGLAFKDPVKVELVDDATFDSRLLSDFDEDTTDLVRSGNQLKALGLLPADTDLASTFRTFLGAGVLGFYDPSTKELVVRGTDLTPYTRQTVAHELTHALDDQWFGLDRPELDKAKDETSFAFSALTEGDAVRVENAYYDSLSRSDQRDLRREESAFGSAPGFTNVPAILAEIVSAPYDLGATLVDDIVAHGGQAALDAAFRSPPTTSEQVMDPSKFLTRETGITVAEPPADGEVTDDGILGELELYLLLSDKLDASDAATAATGWGGDSYVSWAQPDGSTCLRVDFVMDTRRDLDELTTALGRWARSQRHAQVESPSSETVRLTACG